TARPATRLNPIVRTRSTRSVWSTPITTGKGRLATPGSLPTLDKRAHRCGSAESPPKSPTRFVDMSVNHQRTTACLSNKGENLSDGKSSRYERASPHDPEFVATKSGRRRIKKYVLLLLKVISQLVAGAKPLYCHVVPTTSSRNTCCCVGWGISRPQPVRLS